MFDMFMFVIVPELAVEMKVVVDPQMLEAVEVHD